MTEPRPDQLAALADYAHYYGGNWRANLLVDWRRAGSRWPGPYHLLQQLRNNHGPSWLAKEAGKALEEIDTYGPKLPPVPGSFIKKGYS